MPVILDLLGVLGESLELRGQKLEADKVFPAII